MKESDQHFVWFLVYFLLGTVLMFSGHHMLSVFSFIGIVVTIFSAIMFYISGMSLKKAIYD
jgi:hypothetical protein